MSKCKTCHEESYGMNICSSCLDNWSAMRKQAFEFLEKKHGKMNAENHPKIAKEIKKLTSIWRKNKGKFLEAIS